MCGIDFVAPLRGLKLFLESESQGVALGCHVLRLWRGEWQPEGLKQESPGQRPGICGRQIDQALKGRNKTQMRRRFCFAPTGLGRVFGLVPKALPWAVMSLRCQRSGWRPERPKQESPGQSEAPPRETMPQRECALSYFKKQ
jgi:hypothetical protein